MKEIEELVLPDDIRYAKDHEWARLEGESVRVGLSDYAQDQLGDIVFVELPQPGQSFEKGEQFATIESVKAVAECYMPLGGEIMAVNTELEDAPDLVNQSPYGVGWMVQLKPAEPNDLDALMTNDAYLEMLKGLS